MARMEIMFDEMNKQWSNIGSNVKLDVLCNI